MSIPDNPKGTTDRWRRIDALYHEMLARPPGERASALAAACTDDPALLAEVQSLLDQPGSAEEFLNSPAVEVAARLVPGVLGNEASAGKESFAGGDLLEHPHYTRPPVFRGEPVPEVLLSGDHRRVERWRRRESLRATRARRPDLFARLTIDDEDRRLMDTGDDEL